MPYLNIYELVTGLAAALNIIDRNKGKGDGSTVPIHEEPRINTPIDFQVAAAGESKGILGKPIAGYTRVVRGGFVTVTPARLFQVFVQDGDRLYAVSNSSVSGKNLTGELYLTGDQFLVVSTSAAADVGTLSGWLSFQDVLVPT